ncbi:hypothetical protein VPNG_01906 [Cytospora leucostoma]|uniref:Uncharacterized protein n=1 Tax=Cytospora leucostoma TaxID=1230097 RepID=A0A423XJ52_9PEZI|nr:hypothetical protein VPNG_01906 [Cytospora leucostoma]
MQLPSPLHLQVALVALLTASQTLALPRDVSDAADPPKMKSYCGWYGNMGPWEIYTAGWGYNDDTVPKGCAPRLLSKLLEDCHPWTISEWGCEHPRPSWNDDAHGAICRFKLKTAWFNAIWKGCIEKAISRASPTHEQLTCRNMANDE